MVFHTNQRNVTYPNLVINNIIIERVSHFNFLGIMLSYNMTWDAHINHISKKISKAIGILYQLKHIYPQRTLFTLYSTLIVPHLNYCLILWGSYIKENHRLHLLQKKALRIITNSHYIAHSEPIFKDVRCLKITDMFSVAIWKFYFKLMNNKLPHCFSSYKPTTKNNEIFFSHFEQIFAVLLRSLNTLKMRKIILKLSFLKIILSKIILFF